MTEFAVPPPPTTNPLLRIRNDLRAERAARRRHSLPPGPTWWSPARDLRLRRDPLGVLLPAYERYGPVFTTRAVHYASVWMLGPEANHFMLVSNRDAFHWREGSFSELIPLLGDGLLTTDGHPHDRARAIMMPAFHRERILDAADVVLAEADRALDKLRPGDRIDLYDWTRHLAMRVAMRALFGLDPDATGGVDVAHEFERGLSFHETEFVLQLLRGPMSPFARVNAARRVLDRIILAEIVRRRRDGADGTDILSMLMHAEDEDGDALTDEQLRDQVLHLLFAGHDTTTSTVTFLFYELARAPRWRAQLRAELDAVDAPVTGEQLVGGGLPVLDQVMDEVLRLYPPAWVGPRRSVADFEFAGHTVPAGVPVHYCSWASHRLADVFPSPDEFRPERFAPEEKAKLPKGAYVPFGAGPRICIGMRFGQLEVKAFASRILSRFDLEPEPGWKLRVRQMPTLSPRGGMPVRVAARPD